MKKALVCPTFKDKMKMRRGDRTTASTISGLETRTSRASASSSITAALFSDSVKCCVTESFVEIWMTCDWSPELACAAKDDSESANEATRAKANRMDIRERMAGLSISLFSQLRVQRRNE